MNIKVTKINFGIAIFLIMSIFIAGCLYGGAENVSASNHFNQEVWFDTDPDFDWDNHFISNREMSEIMQTFFKKQQEFFSKEFDELKKQNTIKCGCGINE